MSANVWRIRKLGAIASMHARIGWQNLRTMEFLDSGDYYLITGTDFKDGHVNFDTCHYVEKRRFDQDINIQLQVGSILITKDGTLGKVAYIDKLNKPATLNAGVFNVIVRDPQTDEKYLFHLLKSPSLMNYATIKSTGGTIKHLNQNVLVKFPVVLPKDPEEQKHISDILSTCDTVIHNTQKTIDKYKAIKQGMMQDLFTRGLSKDGKLRPSYKEAPELYKESELGMIPKGWEVDCIGNNYMTYAGGTPSREHEEYYKGTIPWVSSSECNQFEINDTNEHITEFAIQNSSTKMVKAGAILLALYGATAGQVAKLNIDATTNQAVLACLSDTKNDNNYLYYYINYIKEKMLYLAQGSGQPNLSKASVDKFIYLMPQKNEQIEIAKRLSSIDSTIQKEEAVLEKYKNIKTGLMARLLTPPDDAEIIDETGETL